MNESSGSIYSRICPVCKSTINYTSELAYSISERLNTICSNCVKKEPEKVVRVIPIPISKIIPDIWEDENGNWCRICGECSKIITHTGYLAKGNAKAGFIKKRNCRSCKAKQQWSENKFYGTKEKINKAKKEYYTNKKNFKRRTKSKTKKI